MLRKTFVGAITGALLSFAAPADAAVGTVVAGPGSQATGSYATPIVVAPAGGPLSFLNQDVQSHGLASDATGPSDQSWCRFFEGEGCPLFWAPTADAGGRTSQVQGMANVVSGETYTFRCYIHPQVTGTLLVI